MSAFAPVKKRESRNGELDADWLETESGSASEEGPS